MVSRAYALIFERNTRYSRYKPLSFPTADWEAAGLERPGTHQVHFSRFLEGAALQPRKSLGSAACGRVPGAVPGTGTGTKSRGLCRLCCISAACSRCRACASGAARSLLHPAACAAVRRCSFPACFALHQVQQVQTCRLLLRQGLRRTWSGSQRCASFDLAPNAGDHPDEFSPGPHRLSPSRTRGTAVWATPPPTPLQGHQVRRMPAYLHQVQRAQRAQRAPRARSPLHGSRRPRRSRSSSRS